MNDLNQLAQINGLEVIRTQRALRATDLSAIANLKALKRVPWAFTSDEALRAVSEMKALESLELASKDVTDVGVDRICRMPSLRNIGLSATGVSAQGLQKLEAMPNVEIVAINFDAGATDQALKVLDGSQKIRALTLRRSEESSITDAGLEIIGRVANLERLDLGYIPITDKGIKHLLKLKKLKVLSLSGTRITNTTLEDLDQLQSLTRLHIEGCEKLTDVGLLELQNVNSLKSLFITPTGYDRGGFSKAGVAELRRLRPNLMIWPDT